MIRHGVELWEELVRVPLFILCARASRRIASRRGAARSISSRRCSICSTSARPDRRASPSTFVSGHRSPTTSSCRRVTQTEARDVFIDMPAGPNNDERRAFIHEGRKLYVFTPSAFRSSISSVIQTKNTISPTMRARVGDAAQYQAFKSQLHEVVVRPSPSEPRFATR